MPALSLCYASCAQRKPHFLKKPAIETVAREARAQLLSPGADALTLAQLAAISDLNINGLPYQLWVSLNHPVTDEDGQPVLGLCEFDPGCGEDAVSVLVSPVGEQLTPELALSTFAHELGHAIFDAPAWLIAARQGPGLFDDLDGGQRRAYRMTTRDAEHLTAAATISTKATAPAQGLSPSSPKFARPNLRRRSASPNSAPTSSWARYWCRGTAWSSWPWPARQILMSASSATAACPTNCTPLLLGW